MTVGCTLTSFIVYCCVAFPSDCDVYSVAEGVPSVPISHALVNTRTSEVDSKGYLLSPRVRRLSRRRIQRLLVAYFVCLFRSPFEGLSRLVSVERH